MESLIITSAVCRRMRCGQCEFLCLCSFSPFRILILFSLCFTYSLQLPCEIRVGYVQCGILRTKSTESLLFFLLLHVSIPSLLGGFVRRSEAVPVVLISAPAGVMLFINLLTLGQYDTKEYFFFHLLGKPDRHHFCQ